MDSVLKLLIKEGFISLQDDNLINAERAFFGARAIHWIRQNSTKPGFNLNAYLVALTYYKLGLADMKIEDDELLYRYTGANLGGLADELSEDDTGTDNGFHIPGNEAQAKEEVDRDNHE